MEPGLHHELHVQQVELKVQNEELRRRQLEIVEAHQRYVDLYDFAPVGYLTLDARGFITLANLTAATFLGAGRDELRGRALSGFMAREDADRWSLRLAALLRSDEPQSFEVAISRSSDSVFHAHLSCRLHVEGTPESTVRVVLTDVSERWAAEAAAHALQSQLMVASRLTALGTLVAGVAHEINNPLTAALADQGLALEVVREILERFQGSDPLDRAAEGLRLVNVVEALDEARKSGKRIARIVKDLSLFGRPDAARKPCRLLDIVDGALRWLPAFVSRDATVHVENAGAPDVLASVGQIEQVVVNLVTNAASSSCAGTLGVIVVRIGPGAPNMARLEVVDHGTGIEPAALGRIFDPFFKALPGGKGTGLGLAISHAIVTSHGGTLAATSTPGRGSTFRVELPAVVPDEPTGPHGP